MDYVDYDESGLMIDKLKIAVHLQDHSSPSFALTLGEKLHIATDTKCDTYNFTRACDLVLHECWSLTDVDAFGHTSLEALTQYAKENKTTRIGLIHINPKFSEEELKAFEGERTFLVHEGQLIEL